MGTTKKLENGNESIPFSEFNGKKYFLYKGEKYFSRGGRRLHLDVWKFYKGYIPKGYDIHHKDENVQNNDISNLSMVSRSLHARFTAKKRFKENPDFAKAFQAKGIEVAKEWHKSDAGREWHKKQGAETWWGREYKDKTCQQCGKDYKTRHAGISKFCHPNCKAKALRDRRKAL